VNIVFVVITLVIVSRIYREHKRLTEQTAAEQAA